MIRSIIDERCITIDNSIDRNKTAHNELQNKREKENRKRRPKYYRKAINYGMLVSLVTSIVGALTGSKKAHVISGAIFMGFGALHMHKHKRNLL